MNALTYMEVKEVSRILKKPENRGAEAKVSASIGGTSGYVLIKPDNREYNRAPVVPCPCHEEAVRFGVALRPSKKEVLFICVRCRDVTVKSSEQYPFMFIKEDDGERQTNVKKKKQTAEILG
jgi:hypothetical protein